MIFRTRQDRRGTGTWVRKLFLGVFLVLILCCFVFTIDKLSPPNLAKFYDTSIAILDHEQRLQNVLLAHDERWRFPIQLEDVDPLYIKMLIAFEDRRFYQHPGVDVLALFRAAWQWLQAGRIVSGGSSLTMQTVRLLEPRPRSLLTKTREIARAIQLEAHFSKKEILEFYLCLAPFGGNLEGIRAASLIYFGKEPKRLTPAEAALLVVLPQSPNRLRLKSNQELTKKNRDKVLHRMERNKVLTRQQISEAMEDPLPSTKHSFPHLASHVAFLVRKQNFVGKPKLGQPLSPQNKIGHEIRLNHQNLKNFSTTLNGTLQKQLETLLKKEIPFLQATQSIAVLVVDNESREVRSYVGSVEFLDEKRKGQVNMVEAIRSPGSLLKPFIYALGFDDGIIHPETIIKDVPTGFSGYSPSNFKDLFHGEVSIREALKQSLNVPAVAVLERLGPARFYSFLRGFSITLKLEKNEDCPSLPIALGGVGMTLWDLVSLYTALANDGEFEPLVLIRGLGEESKPTIKQESRLYKTKTNRLCSAESAQQISEILRETLAPDTFVDRSVTLQDKIAYKTGTSYGYRDAWAIGYNSGYTVGVWLGKPDGTSSAPNTGRIAAAPILFKIFDILPNRGRRDSSGSASGLYSAAEKLPRHLQVFKTKAARLNNIQGSTFEISFPKEGSIINLEKEARQWRSISILLSGGKPPYYCFINGRPMEFASDTNKIQWQPESTGFVEISVVDSQGNSASSAVLLR